MKIKTISDYEDDYYENHYYEEAKKEHDKYREELKLKIMNAKEPYKSFLISLLLKMHC